MKKAILLTVLFCLILISIPIIQNTIEVNASPMANNGDYLLNERVAYPGIPTPYPYPSKIVYLPLIADDFVPVPTPAGPAYP